mgnify:CR=1 FL=1
MDIGEGNFIMKKTISIILCFIIIAGAVCGYLWKLIEIWHSPEALSLIQAFLVIIYLTPLFYDVYCVLQTRKEKLNKILEGSDFRKIEEEIVNFDFYSVLNFVVVFIKYISTLLVAIMIGLLAVSVKEAPDKLYDIIHSATLIILITLIASILFMGILSMFMSVIVFSKVFNPAKVEGILRKNNILARKDIKKILVKDNLLTDLVHYKCIDFILYKEGISYGVYIQRFEDRNIKNKVVQIAYSLVKHISKQAYMRNLIPTIAFVIYEDDIISILLVPLEYIVRTYTPYDNLEELLNDNVSKSSIKVRFKHELIQELIQNEQIDILFHKKVNKKNYKEI